MFSAWVLKSMNLKLGVPKTAEVVHAVLILDHHAFLERCAIHYVQFEEEFSTP